MRAQKSYIDTSSAQVTALWVLFLSGFEKTERGDSSFHFKEHSKTEFGRRIREKVGESETFYRSKFSRATGVSPSAQKWRNRTMIGHELAGM